MSPLSGWYARYEDDVLLYGCGRNNVVHLGDWLIDRFPLSTPTLDDPLEIVEDIRPDHPLDRAISVIQVHKAVYSTRPHALLCALTSAELAAYSEQAFDPTSAPGTFRSMLIDIFGRSYPERQFFMVDRDAVRRYRARVQHNIGVVAGRINAILRNVAVAPSLFSRSTGLYSRHQSQRISCPVMAGHSQFKNIMHKKGRADKARSKLFSKLAREITVSAKIGLPDPAHNPRLRAAILAARAENMPKDNIERAIKKASGSDQENYEEIRYEGYAPGGVAVIVEALTDNNNRTAGEVRAIFTKAGGNLATTGAVSFMFDHVGVIEYDAAKASADAMLEAAIEAGAEDVISNDDGHQVISKSDTLHEVAKALEAKFGEPRKSGMVWKPQNTVAVDDEAGEKVLKLMEALDEADDVQNVYANFEISDALVQKMSAA